MGVKQGCVMAQTLFTNMMFSAMRMGAFQDCDTSFSIPMIYVLRLLAKNASQRYVSVVGSR